MCFWYLLTYLLISNLSLNTLTYTDVEVIAGFFCCENQYKWVFIAYGAVKHFRYLAIRKIAYSIAPSKSRGLLFLQMFTGCYQISAFANKEKIYCETWLSYGKIWICYYDKKPVKKGNYALCYRNVSLFFCQNLFYIYMTCPIQYYFYFIIFL